MAIIDTKGRPRGKFLNATFRALNGKCVMQSKSNSQKQTVRTRQAASDFGKVQSYNKLLRRPIQYALNNNHCKKMYKRLNSLVLKQFHLNEKVPLGQRTFLNTDLSNLVGFDFNSNSPFNQYCSLPIKFEKQGNMKLKITIHSFTVNDYFNFKENISEIKVDLFILHQQFNYQETREYETINFSVYDNKKVSAKEWIIEFPLNESLTVIIGQLWCIKKTITQQAVMINNKDFHPSCILYLDNGI
ncbi:hypothetical protein SAMN04488018_11291 [Myroides marinus]|uniref:Uncharacterized protein n=1 Tax=Myroides marinus TaxID=703342 RepID=A0A1H6W6Z4_9FLAO|nr:hypothetical protein [Myroides marinus]MDM1354593.1 hypothetical protein [Myroides marinus]SEJ11556.1 hypothetical protein SAMN04488018_11291 [Myroides marinus]